MTKLSKLTTPFLFMCAGAAVTLFSVRSMQVVTNNHERSECKSVHHRRLVTFSSVAGSVNYCAPLHLFNQ
jgi:hypothetical protein